MDDSKGSKRHIRWYVNNASRQLDATLGTASADLARNMRGAVRWVSPLVADGYRELWDASFLRAVGLGGDVERLGQFWPDGGPHWDSLGVVSTSGRDGVILVEAKAHLGELKQNDPSTAKAVKSVELIRASLVECRNLLRVPGSAPDWTTTYYQTANRIAHLHFLRNVLRVPAWLAYVFVVDAPEWPDRGSVAAWRSAYDGMLEHMGLPRDHALAEYMFPVYLAPAAPEQ